MSGSRVGSERRKSMSVPPAGASEHRARPGSVQAGVSRAWCDGDRCFCKSHLFIIILSVQPAVSQCGRERVDPRTHRTHIAMHIAIRTSTAPRALAVVWRGGKGVGRYTPRGRTPAGQVPGLLRRQAGASADACSRCRSSLRMARRRVHGICRSPNSRLRRSLRGSTEINFYTSTLQ